MDAADTGMWGCGEADSANDVMDAADVGMWGHNGYGRPHSIEEYQIFLTKIGVI
jgi:hypothetical protein